MEKITMATTPASLPTTSHGVSNLLTGFTVLNEDISETEIYHQVPDQMGAIVAEHPYDVRYDLSLTVIGAGTLPSAGDRTFSYASATRKVDKISKPSAYNDLKKYNITAYRYTNFPTA